MPANVLIIDDNAGFRESLNARFVGLGIEADFADGWQEGLELFRVAQYQLVIADYNLPGSDHGLQLLGEIRVLNPGARLVLISGEFGEERRKDVLDADVVDAFFTKTPSDLRILVEEAHAAATRGGQPVNWQTVAQAYRKSAELDGKVLSDLDEKLRKDLNSPVD